MIARIIENWLINSTERIYQIPFCQILGLKGYHVLHLSSHGVSEHGKDIIAKDNNNQPCAFQLKTGDINASKWRQIYPEITELVETAIDHPSINTQHMRRTILVTNGKINDDIRTKITSLNRDYKRRNLPKLEIITGKELLQDFIAAQGLFLPSEPKELQDFLELYTSDGRQNIDEQKYSNFINGALYDKNKNIMLKESSRRIASALLMAKYSLYPFEKADNHLSVIKGLVLFYSAVLMVVEKNRLPEKYWFQSLTLCWYNIKREIELFKEEIISRNNKFLEGNIEGDGEFVYKARVTIIMGWIAAYELIHKFENPDYSFDKTISDLIKANFPSNVCVWGESAIAYFIIIALYLSQMGDKESAIEIYKRTLTTLATNNSYKNNKGLPDPYYSPEEILLARSGDPDAELDLSAFVGTAYTLRVLIDCLIREGRRDILEGLWRSISYIQYCEFLPKPLWANYLWHCDDGVEHIKAFDSPQSWAKLKDDAYVKPANVPNYLIKNRAFHIAFALTYPHRMRSDMLKCIDHNFIGSNNK